MHQNQSADLEKKSRRQQAINAIEVLLENDKTSDIGAMEARLNVLDKQIKAKEGVLNAHTIEVSEMVTRSEELVQKFRNQEDDARKAVETQEGILAGLKAQVINVNSSIRVKKTGLTDIQNQVKETRDYFKEQEKLTEDTIAEWNSTLVEFHKEAENVHTEKNKLSADIIRLGQDKAALTEEIEHVQDKFESLAKVYNTKVSEYKADLQVLDDKIVQRQRKLNELEDDLVMRLKAIETRERSYSLKEASLKEHESELNQKERRLKMNYGIAGIDYDV